MSFLRETLAALNCRFFSAVKNPGEMKGSSREGRAEDL